MRLCRLDSLPCDRHDPVEILDHYLTDTRLLVKLTNIYLSEQEYLALIDLDARSLRKTRWHWDFSGRSMAADDFHGPLSGLVLAEVELSLDDERLPMPPGGIADVTDDDRFSGGTLAALGRHGAEDLMRLVARMRSPRP